MYIVHVHVCTLYMYILYYDPLLFGLASLSEKTEQEVRCMCAGSAMQTDWL